jgi:hypothetical protein
LDFGLSVDSNPVFVRVSGVCREPDAVMPLTTRTGEQVGGIAVQALSAVLLIFGPNGF